MPADKLELLCKSITPKFSRLAKEKGERKWGYEMVLDLATTDEKIPVVLYFKGRRNGINKIVFVDVAHLTLSRVEDIVTEIFGDLKNVSIWRLDWCVDLDVPIREIALYCQIPRAQNCKIIHYRGASSFYLRYSKTCIIYMYDKHRQLMAKRDHLSRNYKLVDPLTRIEIQLRGNGLPFRQLADIRRYGDLDLLADLVFWRVGRGHGRRTPMESLAVEGLLRKIAEDGLQMALKSFSSPERAYILKKFLRPAHKSRYRDLNELMKKSTREWLENIVRFPRLPKRRRT